MRENVEASGKNEEISKILLQVADELKIVCHNLESELSQFQIKGKYEKNFANCFNCSFFCWLC